MAVAVETHQTRLLRALPGVCKTLDVLSDELGWSHRQVTNAASALIRKGLAERVEAGCFQLTPQGAEAVMAGMEITSGPNGPHESTQKPLPNTLRQRAWNVMRIQRSFTIHDLLVAATQGQEKDAINNLQRYCRLLAKAGVLRLMKRRVAGTKPTSNGYQKYQLLKNLGEFAPTVRPKTGVLHDHNSGEEFKL